MVCSIIGQCQINLFPLRSSLFSQFCYMIEDKLSVLRDFLPDNLLKRFLQLLYNKLLLLKLSANFFPMLLI